MRGRSKLRLSDVLAAGLGHLGDPSYPPYTRSVLHRLARCKSGAFGYMQFACDGCGHVEWRPRGCGSRHCSSCGYQRTDEWVARCTTELLDTPYFQLVFTLPPLFYPLVKDNPEKLYSIFFDSVRETILELANDPKHLGGTPQFFMVLHTWNAALDFHVHIHVLLAAGAYDRESDTWIPSKHPNFLFPIKVLSALFRGKFLDKLNDLAKAGLLELRLLENQALTAPGAWQDFLSTAYRTDFFTYEENPAAGPLNVLQYLGHYLQRTGLSNHRLLSLEDGVVKFRCKDRKRRHSKTGSYVRALPLNDFIDLYAQHILPKGFRRLRMCGLWAPSQKKLLPKVRDAIVRGRAEGTVTTPEHEAMPSLRVCTSPTLCPACKKHPLTLTYSVIFHRSGSIVIDHRRARDPPPRSPPPPAPAPTT
jgi:hypothetical protein